jgi:hypothetical protein
MGAGAICLTHFGGGIEFVSVVAGGTGMGAVGGASSACGGGATGAAAAAVCRGGGYFGRGDPAISRRSALGHPCTAERLAKAMCILKHWCETWRRRERERERDVKGGGGGGSSSRVSD